MASVSYWQTHYWRLIATGKVRLGVDPFKIALLTSAYARNAAHAQWSDISGFEVAAGNGYTAGGQSLVLAVNGITDDAIIYIDPVWTALTKTFRWAAVVCDINVDALVKPLIGIVLDVYKRQFRACARSWAKSRRCLRPSRRTCPPRLKA